jgi:ribonucleoside-diphosphate reductase alpha chain
VERDDDRRGDAISGLYDGATTRELDQLSIQTAAGLIAEEPSYAKLAARLLATYIDKEVRGQEIHAFSQSVLTAQRLGLGWPTNGWRPSSPPTRAS